MDSDKKKTLVASIVAYLENEIKENVEKPELVDFVEGLEVSVQCIRSSFDLTSIDADCVPSLADTFAAGCKSLNCPEVAIKREVTADDKVEAERLKADGNKFISESKYLEAVNSYTQAIDKDPYNAVYYGNRAAAYSKLNDHAAAIRDCERALQNDPVYSKAYGRMGFAYAAQKNHAKAVECYEKALALEPENSSYKQNLETAKAALPADDSASGAAAGGFPGFPGFGGRGGAGGPGGGLDLMSMLNNPQMMQMASQMMQSPQVQQMVASMMGGAGAGFGATGAGASSETAETPAASIAAGSGESSTSNNEQDQNPAPGQPNMQDLLRMGQQFASQMHATNPDLVESLRQEFQQGGGVGGGGSDGGGSGGGQNPPAPPSSDNNGGDGSTS